jgi:hypothetical protein
MVNLCIKTCTGNIYQNININEYDITYGDLIKYIKKPSSKYNEYKGNFGNNNYKYNYDEVYIDTKINLFNEGHCVNLDDEIIKYTLTILFTFDYYRYNDYFDEIIKINNEISSSSNLIDTLKNDPYQILFFDEDKINDEICKMILDINTFVLQCIPDKYKTEEICRYSINKDGSLKYVNKKFLNNECGFELCKIAIEMYPNSIKFINNELLSTEKYYEICSLATKDGYANTNLLKYIPIEHQTIELCKLCINYNCKLLKYVINQTDELCKMAIEKNPSMLKYVINQTDELCKMAILFDYNTLKYIVKEKKTFEICKFAIDRNVMAIQYILSDKKSDIYELCKIVVKKYGKILQFIPNDFIQLFNENEKINIYKLAVEQNGLALQFIPIEYRTSEICDLAVKRNNEAFLYCNK